jgi:hypothetical protein
LIATDLAFARAAKERGQWTAFAEYAAKEAILFDPQPIPAHPWLKGRANPPSTMTWQPYSAWLSCDGSLGISQGAWQQADAHGRYVTVWARQDDGTYRWTIAQRGTDMENLAAPEMLDAKVASCKGPRPAANEPEIADDAERSGASRDRSLDWAVRDEPRCGRTLTATMSRGPNEPREQVVRLRISPPTDAGGAPASCPG